MLNNKMQIFSNIVWYQLAMATSHKNRLLKGGVVTHVMTVALEWASLYHILPQHILKNKTHNEEFTYWYYMTGISNSEEKNDQRSKSYF